eukprot:scaffold12292_cov112-Isochrysis_galbana.AAC.9
MLHVSAGASGGADMGQTGGKRGQIGTTCNRCGRRKTAPRPRTQRARGQPAQFHSNCRSHEEDLKTDTGHIQGAHKTTKGSTLIEDESVGDRQMTDSMGERRTDEKIYLLANAFTPHTAHVARRRRVVWTFFFWGEPLGRSELGGMAAALNTNTRRPPSEVLPPRLLPAAGDRAHGGRPYALTQHLAPVGGLVAGGAGGAAHAACAGLTDTRPRRRRRRWPPHQRPHQHRLFFTLTHWSGPLDTPLSHSHVPLVTCPLSQGPPFTGPSSQHLIDHLVVLNPEPILVQELVDVDGKRGRVLVLVQVGEALLGKPLLHGARGLHQVEVRDLGEEEVVHHVAIGDVVVQVVHSAAKGAVDGLEGAPHVAPGTLAEEQHLVEVVLEKSDGKEPPAVPHPRQAVRPHHRLAQQRVPAKHGGYRDRRRGVPAHHLGGGGVLPEAAVEEEVAAVGLTDIQVGPPVEEGRGHPDRVVECQVRQAQHLAPLRLGVPHVRVVFLDVVVIRVVAVVRAAPRRKGRAEQHRVAQLAHQLVDRLVRREGGVAAVVPDHEHAPHEESGGELERQQQGALQGERERRERTAPAQPDDGPHHRRHAPRVACPIGHRLCCRELKHLLGEPALDLTERRVLLVEHHLPVFLLPRRVPLLLRPVRCTAHCTSRSARVDPQGCSEGDAIAR